MLWGDPGLLEHTLTGSYYRCSDSNCDVKKTVERGAHDKGIVITSYLGRHNHERQCVIYYIGKPETYQQPTASTILQHISPVCSYVPESFEQHQ
uniref:WRKY domain-containing protein n=1 Tax=Picea sitchensis TaxID=3332 RepID=D5AA77_PICSI|nr:unknown [Picea sitchensis]